MQAVTNFLTEPGVLTGVLGIASVILGFATKGFFDERAENRRQQNEAERQKEQRQHEAEQQKEQREHEAAMQREEADDKRSQVYARFLAMAHRVNEARYLGRMLESDIKELSENFAQVEIAAISHRVREEAYNVFQSAKRGPGNVLNTDKFLIAIKVEKDERE